MGDLVAKQQFHYENHEDKGILPAQQAKYDVTMLNNKLKSQRKHGRMLS